MKTTEEPYFVPGKRKYLFYTDQMGKSLLKPIIDEAIVNNDSFELVFKGTSKFELQATDIVKWLSQQKMGSYLYVALPWHEIYDFKKMIESIGLTDEESQLIGHGQQNVKVFCCRCHGITEELHIEMDQHLNCQHCHLLLVVSDHYSRLKNAYLGYVAKL